jgi:uncharacterized UPF0160 family protein
MKIVTHSGPFHADDVLAVAALLLKYPDATVVRSRDKEVIDSADIAVDVGFASDPEKKRFDHHQPSGAGKRPNGIPYASFGLVWKEYGEELAGGMDEAKVIDEKIGMPIDAIDNGVIISTPIFDGVREYSMGDYFESFIHEAGTYEEMDRAFFEAIGQARDFLARKIASAKRSVIEWRRVKDIYNESENKRVITLPEHMHWKRALIPTEAQYVVTPRIDGLWMIQGVPNAVHGFEPKRRFPSSWGGLSDGVLAEVSGVPGTIFCHKNCHLAVVETKEAALKLAEAAINS